MPRTGKPKRDDKPVKVDRTIATKAALVAHVRGIPLAEYVSELLRDHVERDWHKAVRDINIKKSEKP